MAVPSRKVVDRRNRKGAKKHRPDIIVVDLKDHVLGRAAAVVAKQLLLGKKITAVRCEKIAIAGTEIRNKIKYLIYLRKRKLTNPKKGPFHHRSPSDVFVRTVRSMLPRYTKRGQKALRGLVAYEGVPVNVARTGARVVIPKAQRFACHKSERPYTVLGNMCKHVGWKYSDVVDKLEKARVEKAARFHKKTEKVRAAWTVARKEALGPNTSNSPPDTKDVDLSDNVDKACLSVSRSVPLPGESVVHMAVDQVNIQPDGDGDWSDIQATEARIADVREIAPETEGSSHDISVDNQAIDKHHEQGTSTFHQP